MAADDLRAAAVVIEEAIRRAGGNAKVIVIEELGEIIVGFRRRAVMVKVSRRRHPVPPSIMVRRVGRARGFNEYAEMVGLEFRVNRVVAVFRKLTSGSKILAARLARAGRVVVESTGVCNLVNLILDAVWAACGVLASLTTAAATFWAKLQLMIERVGRSLHGFTPCECAEPPPAPAGY